jgi:hypothetical protein
MLAGALANLVCDFGRARQERDGSPGHTHHRNIHWQSTQDLALPGIELVEALPLEQPAIDALGLHRGDNGIDDTLALLSRRLSAVEELDLERFGCLE